MRFRIIFSGDYYSPYRVEVEEWKGIIFKRSYWKRITDFKTHEEAEKAVTEFLAIGEKVYE